MHARAAYIRSIGTTSILVAAALLMLGVVGALVGFHGWPEGAVGGAVQAVPLTPTPQPVLSAVREVRKAPSASRAGRRLRDRRATAGLVKQVPVRSPRPVGYPVALSPGHGGPTAGGTPSSGREPQPAAPKPADPGEIEALVGEVVGSLPPIPQPDQPVTVGIPVVGGTVSVPPLPVR